MADGLHGRRLAPDVVRQRVQSVTEALGLGSLMKAGRMARPLRIVGLGAGAWGAVFMAMLQEMYGSMPDMVDITIWRRGGRHVKKDAVARLMEVVNADEAVLRRLRNSSVYLKYVSARLGDRTLTADEMLRDGFCLNLPDCPLCPLKVTTELEEAVYDADIIVNGLPSTETRNVFEKVGHILKQSRNAERPMPAVISLSKGVETRLSPHPHIVTPTRIVHEAGGVPTDRCFYLGGPNIAAEIWRGEYANARICGGTKPVRRALAEFIRNDNFVVWTSSDVITHEVLGGLKNVYAIGMGITTAATNDSATSKAVYFSNAAAEMVFITRLLSHHPDDLQGPLLADTYVTLLKGRNAWYGERLGSGELSPSMGDVVPGKGLIQGVSAVHAFHELLSDPRVSVYDCDREEEVSPVEVLPMLCNLKALLSRQDGDMREAARAFIDKLKDASASDPAQRLRTENLYCAMLTRLPHEMDAGDCDGGSGGGGSDKVGRRQRTVSGRVHVRDDEDDEEATGVVEAMQTMQFTGEGRHGKDGAGR